MRGQIRMKDKILQTSLTLFDQKGYRETSIQDIVDSLGVTKGTFYYYYSSKEELLKAICLAYIENLVQHQEEIIHHPTKTNTEKLHDIIYMLLDRIERERNEARIFFREMRNIKEEHIEEIKQIRNQFRLNYQKVLEDGIKNGEFKANAHPNILALGILGITNWSYYWYSSEGEMSVEELTRLYLDFILHGIKS